MLDAGMKDQLRQHLTLLREPIELVASLGDDAKSTQTRELLGEIAELSDKVSAAFDGNDERKPSFVIRRASDAEKWVRFAGLPRGHEFTSLVLALLWAGGHPPKVSDDVLRQIAELEGDFAFEMYFSLSCHNCPDVVQALTLTALINPRVSATLIEGGSFAEEVEQRGVMAVPAVFLDGKMFASGKMGVEEILAKLDSGADARAAARLAEKKPFDVLVVGGGPAGAAAAIYAARKGFSTGIAATRFGGQVLDTLGIENFVSVQYTEGPKLVRELEAHVAENGVDVMNLAEAQALIPARRRGGMHEVVLKNGATLVDMGIVAPGGWMAPAPGARRPPWPRPGSTAPPAPPSADPSVDEAGSRGGFGLRV